MQSAIINNAEVFFETKGDAAKPVVVWAHGWGQSHKAFLPIVASLESCAHHLLIDLPGFGESPPPDNAWSTADYADAMAALIQKNTDQPVIWIGHSFGCRVGLQIAARHPDVIKGMALIAAAGLPRKRALHQRLIHIVRVYSFKFLKKLIPLGLDEDWLRSKFGSADYRSSGAMRDILVKTVNENLSEVAPKITCPVTLIYGTKDTETPIEIGQRLNKLISGSQIIPLDGLDHYSVLSEGRHQVTPLIKNIIKDLNPNND